MILKTFARKATPMITMLIVGTTAAGCSPAPKSLLAVERTSTGRARVLIAPCPGYKAQVISAFSSGGTVEYKRWSIINDAMGGSLDSVELFSAPPGWSVTRSDLNELKDGGEYTVVLNGGSNGYGLDGEITFTPDRFGALKAGEVIARDGKGSKTVKRADFMKKDAERCTPK
ncbi:hypothetical protein Slala03_76490 [Streptomyces lavendulae subsp. lavendulae]|nr:hypothetical protein Slala03_76490 [Streptomyces lavendulae subsp. lavendulae]